MKCIFKWGNINHVGVIISAIDTFLIFFTYTVCRKKTRRKSKCVNNSFQFLVAQKLLVYFHFNFVIWHNVCVPVFVSEDYVSSPYIKRLLMESTPFLFFAILFIEIISRPLWGPFAVRGSFTARDHFCGPAHLQPTNQPTNKNTVNG